MRIPIHIEIYPSLMGFDDTPEGAELAGQRLEHWLAHGMSAALQSGGVIFGQKLVALKLPEEPVPQEITRYDDLIVIPVATAGGVDQIIAQVSELLAKLNGVQIDGLADQMEELLAQSTVTMASLQAVAASGDTLLGEASQQGLVESLNKTLLQFEALAQNYGPDSTTDRELKQLLEVMVDVLSDLQPILTELKHKPNSLIFTGSGDTEREPQRKVQ
jgi:paraquat-inducible protein B